jgi:hypothetical protein
MKKFILSLIALATYVQAFSQDSDTVTIASDRPGISEASVAVPKGYFQIESGFDYTWQNVVDFRYYSIGNTSLLKYGLTNFLELRLLQSYAINGSNFTTSDGDQYQTGFTPTIIGIKTNLTKADQLIPEMALVAQFALPKQSGELAYDALQSFITLTATHYLNQGWSAGYNLGVTFDEASDTEFRYTLWGAYGFSDQLSGFLEFYGTETQSTFLSLYTDFGLTYLCTPRLQLDASVGFDLFDEVNGESAYKSGFVSAGIAYLFHL